MTTIAELHEEARQLLKDATAIEGQGYPGLAQTYRDDADELYRMAAAKERRNALRNQLAIEAGETYDGSSYGPRE